jgi:hypothetical protein
MYCDEIAQQFRRRVAAVAIAWAPASASPQVTQRDPMPPGQTKSARFIG